MFKKIFITILVIGLNPILSFADSSTSSLSKLCIPTWEGKEMFKHLDDYKTVDEEQYHIRYRVKGYYFSDAYAFSNSILNTFDCLLSYKNDDSARGFVCYDSLRSKTVEVGNYYSPMVSNFTLGESSPFSLGRYQDSEYIKVLNPGNKIYIKKLKPKLFKRAVKAGLLYDYDNVSIVCVVSGYRNVGCKNSNGHGFFTENNQILTF